MTRYRSNLMYLLFLAVFCVPGSTLAELHKPSDNAAVWYLTAQLVLDSADEEAIGSLIGDDSAPQDTASKAKAIEQLQEALRYTRRAASLDNCSWAVDLQEDGPAALLHHLSFLRQQAKLLSSVAWFHSEQDETRDLAITDALAVMRMSRHAAADGTVIGCLVQHSIDSKARIMLATELHRFDRNQLEHVRAEIKALPPHQPMRTAVLSERQLVHWLRKKNQKGELLGFMQQAGGSSVGVIEKAFEGLAPEAQQKMVLGWLDEMDALYVQLTENMALPFGEFKKANRAYEKKVMEGNPLVQAMMPALGSARIREVEAQIAHRILQAMIAYRLGGEQAFREVVDPIDGKPFTMEKTEDHFIVSSRIMNRQGVAVRLLFNPESAEPLK